MLGSGPEVVAEATKVLEAVAAASTDIDLQLESHDFGGCAIDKHGVALPDSTLKACKEADAILMGMFYSVLRCEHLNECVDQVQSVVPSGESTAKSALNKASSPCAKPSVSTPTSAPRISPPTVCWTTLP